MSMLAKSQILINRECKINMSRRAKNPKNKLAWGPINLEPKSISVSEAIYFIVQGITAKDIHRYVVIRYPHIY